MGVTRISLEELINIFHVDVREKIRERAKRTRASHIVVCEDDLGTRTALMVGPDLNYTITDILAGENPRLTSGTMGVQKLATHFASVDPPGRCEVFNLSTGTYWYKYENMTPDAAVLRANEEAKQPVAPLMMGHSRAHCGDFSCMRPVVLP